VIDDPHRSRSRAPLHVGIIMDGNGRWAERRGLPRAAGHRAGVEAVRRVVRAAPALGVGTLTLYAFSSDNWRRPEPEVRALLTLLREYLASEAAACAREGVRLRVIGRRDRLPLRLRDAVARAEAATANASALELRIAIDYSARDALLAAAERCGGTGPLTRERFAAELAEAAHAGPGPNEVDLLVRTGGERRLSDFLLWECAYAELRFTRTAWPDFGARHLAAAVADFRRRERRFGALAARPARAAGPVAAPHPPRAASA
jgi:undecaprenyl diphosphate synthase